MSDIKLFSLNGDVSELPSSSVALERELQINIEKNMEKFFGVRFLKSEYTITNGRIDSLGLDENFCPVIFEYKRSINENVINQGLFYLDWLLDHKADFKLLVLETLGTDAANKIDWSLPCVICIASDFTRYDEHAVNQMQRNIKLVKYKKFGEDLILFEHLNAPKVKSDLIESITLPKVVNNKKSSEKTFLQQFECATVEWQNIYLTIKDYILSLGDDITENQLKLYVAFKKVRNIACVELYASQKYILIHLALDPKTVELKKDFTRDMTNIGHYGTGNLRVRIKSLKDFYEAKTLIERAYNEG